jgi:CheY-like chemotaxis protein
MDAAVRARAIEPFYSTKEFGQGTGLGLSMVHGLAAQLGGGFALTSAPGAGTQVDLYLPVAEEKTAAQPRPAAEAAPALGRRLSVLLIDDEDIVRTATAEMIRDLGHGVEEAGSGLEALTLIESGPEIDVVVTDYMMPGMDGGALARQVARVRADLPVLLITGYTGSDEDVRHLPRLSKPFGRTEIGNALESLFAEDRKVVRLSSRNRPS